MSGSANYKCYSPIANGGGSGANSNCSSNRNSASQQEHRRTRSNTSNNSNFSVTDQELRTRLIFSRAMSSQDSSREALDNRDRDLNSGETVFQAESESCAAPLLPAPMPSNSIVSSTAPRSLAIAPPVSAASVATAAAQTEAATSFSPSSSSRMLPTPQGSSLCRSPEETPDLVDLANWLDDTDSGHPFTRAALCGDAATIKEMCSKHTFDPNGKKAHHALLAACRSGHIEVARVLLDAGVDVHCKDAKSGWQAIHYAAYKDRVKVVELLLGYGEWGARCVALVRVRGVTCSLLHLAAHYGCCAVLAFLLSNNANLVKLNLAIDMRDAGHWTSLHHAVCESRVRACEVLLQAGADVNITDPHGVTALHVAAKKDNLGLFRLLMEHKANPKLNVINAGTSQERVFERVEPFIKFLEGSTLLHWAASRGHHDIVGDLLARGLKVDARDSLGRTPLGVTMWAGHSNIVALLQHEKLQLTDEDKNWAHIPSEEVGLCIVKCIKDTGVCELTACRPDGFSLLHLAAQKGYPNMTHALVSLKVNPDIPNNQGETPLFIAIKNNQLACVQQLLNAGTKLSRTDNRGGSALHVAAKMGNVTVVDMLLTSSESGERIIDINKCDNIGYTPVYYAINASRYDIVQRFLEYSLVEKVHVKATNHETLLQFFTERNNLGQFDNALVRVLECEQLLHATKASAEMCLRVQLGTTEASTKARSQLQAMYESTPAQQHCWNFWFFLSCFLVPSVFYYLDVYTDILLAVEYYKDFKNANSTEISEDQSLMHMFENFVENQDKTNFVLTVFFILLPTTLLSLWSLYIHVTQADILPIFKNMPSVLRLLLYVLVFLTPLAPIIVYLENTYAQMKHMNVTSRQMQEQVDGSKSFNNLPGQQNNSSNTNNTRAESNTAGTTKTYRHHTRDQKIRKYYDLKHVAQMRVAITNVMEATLESAFQLILQLYIVGTHYTDLVKVREVTLGAILTLSSDGQETRLGKQVFSVLISLVSLTWSFTSYHRFSKLGGLTILSALPLLFAIFFQVVSRAIACTMFTLAYTWRIFVVLGVHFIIVLGFKLRLEERSLIPPRPHTYCHCLFSTIRPYFYVFLGTIASTLVYFRLERPSVVKKQLSRRHSTVVIQVLFLLLSFLENFILLFLGMAGLDRNKYDNTFMAVSGALCVLSYFIGIVLHGVYYACFGHPWVDINGPKFQKDEDEKTWIVSYYRQGKMNKWTVRSCCDITHNEEEPDDDVYRTPEMQMNGGNPIRQVKDI
ncbi:uncharacterized protein LOC108682971 isoform X5 [Hyalella azteca]|uniref:XK-related protein n=1 Tax=Hyalella azteca TaxID=294128 RepID=A0A979FU14_HYAAZ|nr:uncharacterized protein LOC108682971 isoform X5 [Hyalella azteca]